MPLWGEVKGFVSSAIKHSKIYFKKEKKKNASESLKHYSSLYFFRERKCAEASEGNSKSLLMKIQVSRSSKVKTISFTAQSNSFDQPNNIIVRRIIL